MPTRLARWVCVLTALAAGSTFAADKPKEKKGKPATPTLIPESNLPPISLPTATPRNADGKFVVSKPVGNWVRETGTYRLVLAITDERLTLTIEPRLSPSSGGIRLDADYAINKESCLFGVIDSFEAEQSDDMRKQQMSGQPFSVRFRVEGDSLTLKEFKGLGVGIGPFTDREAESLAVVCGKYTSAEAKLKELQKQPEVPHLTPQRIHGGILKAEPPTNGDPLLRQDRLLNQSEDLGQIVETWRRFWFEDMPSYLTPQRIHGGILGPPCDIDTRPTTSAYVGPISRATASPPWMNSAVIQASVDVSASEPPRLIPQLREDDCPKCDPPTDAEVMQVFNERRAKDGVSFVLSHDEDGVTIVKNLVSEKADAPRVYPLLGIGRSQCCRWECGVYYNDPKQSSVSSPTYIRKSKVEVISFESSTVRMMVPAGDTGIPQRMTEK